MRKYLRFLTLSVALLGYYLGCSQQQFMITQYMYNGLPINPAYAGIHEGLSASVLTRHQWVGIEGAPNTQFISVHSPLKFHKASLGAVLYRDEIGIKKEHSGYFSYAYRIGITQKIKLSMALQLNFHQLNQEYKMGAADDPNDPLLMDDNAVKINSGTGIMLHSDRFYLGFSIPQMMKTKFGSDQSLGHLVQHYYIAGGYVFNIVEGLILKPNFLVKAVKNAPTQYDLNANVLIKNLLWLGINHRWKESNALLMALQLGPSFQIGYSADLNNNDLQSTSHEIMVNYVFKRDNQKMLTPRYF